jgi:heme-degrading monooxygenase HmoA
MLARVITTTTSPEGLESVLQTVHEQMPAFRQQPGFTGFYLLADREAGQLMTISLWESLESIRAVEARAAEATSQTTARSGGIGPREIALYEIVAQA